MIDFDSARCRIKLASLHIEQDPVEQLHKEALNWGAVGQTASRALRHGGLVGAGVGAAAGGVGGALTAQPGEDRWRRAAVGAAGGAAAGGAVGAGAKYLAGRVAKAAPAATVIKATEPAIGAAKAAPAAKSGVAPTLIERQRAGTIAQGPAPSAMQTAVSGGQPSTMQSAGVPTLKDHPAAPNVTVVPVGEARTMAAVPRPNRGPKPPPRNATAIAHEADVAHFKSLPATQQQAIMRHPLVASGQMPPEAAAKLMAWSGGAEKAIASSRASAGLGSGGLLPEYAMLKAAARMRAKLAKAKADPKMLYERIRSQAPVEVVVGEEGHPLEQMGPHYNPWGNTAALQLLGAPRSVGKYKVPEDSYIYSTGPGKRLVRGNLLLGDVDAPSEAVLAHEVGHATDARSGVVGDALQSPYLRSMAAALGSMAPVAGMLAHHNLRDYGGAVAIPAAMGTSMLAHGAGQLPTLLAERRATQIGLQKLREAGAAEEQLKDYEQGLASAGGTYGRGALINAALTGGLVGLKALAMQKDAASKQSEEYIKAHKRLTDRLYAPTLAGAVTGGLVGASPGILLARSLLASKVPNTRAAALGVAPMALGGGILGAVAGGGVGRALGHLDPRISQLREEAEAVRPRLPFEKQARTFVGGFGGGGSMMMPSMPAPAVSGSMGGAKFVGFTGGGGRGRMIGSDAGSAMVARYQAEQAVQGMMMQNEFNKAYANALGRMARGSTSVKYSAARAELERLALAPTTEASVVRA